MSLWLAGATALLLGLLPCAFLCLRGSPADRLVGLEMSGLIAALVFVCLAQGFERAIYLDLAVALALLSFAGGLVFVHFLERWV